MNETFTDRIHTDPRATCSVPADTAVLGVLLQFSFSFLFFFDHTFTRASRASVLGSAVCGVSICFPLRLKYSSVMTMSHAGEEKQRVLLCLDSKRWRINKLWCSDA